MTYLTQMKSVILQLSFTYISIRYTGLLLAERPENALLATKNMLQLKED